MRTSVRLWKTDKEGELVVDGDERAVLLAYGLDDEVENRDQAAAEKLQPKKPKAEEKAEDPAPNKSQSNDGDKTEKAPAKKATAKKSAPKSRGRVH